MRHATALIASVLLGVLAAACASSSVPELATTYSADVGRASRTQIDESLARMLNRYSYEILRVEEHQSTLYVYTRWLWREPFDDEVALGYSQASTRITVEARAIGDTRSDPTSVWRVRLRAENRLMRRLGSEWEEPALTDMFTEYMDKIVSDIRTEFQSRFR